MRIHKFPKKRYKARKKKKTHTCPVIVSSDTHPANDAAYATGEERERQSAFTASLALTSLSP